MKIRLGELLVQANLITEDQLKQALQAQKVYGGKLGTNLVELGFVTDEALAKVLGEQLKLPAAESTEFDSISADALKMINSEFAAKHKVIPLQFDTKLRVGICDPFSLPEVEQLQFTLSHPIQAVIAPEIWIVAALEKYYGIPRDMRYIPVDNKSEGFVGEMTNIIADVVAINAPSVTKEAAPQSQEFNLSLNDFSNLLLQCDAPEKVFRTLFEFLSPLFPQMALYIIAKNQIGGRLLHGFAIHLRNFVQVRSDIDQLDIFKRVTEEKKPFRGKIGQSANDRPMTEPLALPQEQAVGLYPIHFRDKSIALLLGVPRPKSAPPIPEAGRIVEEAITKCSQMLEVLFLQRQIAKNPQPAKGQ